MCYDNSLHSGDNYVIKLIIHGLGLRLLCGHYFKNNRDFLSPSIIREKSGIVHVDMAETGELSRGQPSLVELVESDEESGAQNSSSSATASSLLNHLRPPKSSEQSRTIFKLLTPSGLYV